LMITPTTFPTEQHMEQANSTTNDPRTVAALNDLLKLDHDAVQAYALAIKALSSETLRSQMREHRADHERHIDELSQLIRSRGGTPVSLPHLPTGAFKLAVQAIGATGDDRSVLVAFKANERQVRDKYRRVAQREHDGDITSVLARAAEDEARHYQWALDSLRALGWTEDSVSGRMERAFETAHAGMADAIENAERATLEATEAARKSVTEEIRKNPIGSAVVALAAGFVAATMVRRR
jgi:rubrerythrin